MFEETYPPKLSNLASVLANVVLIKGSIYQLVSTCEAQHVGSRLTSLPLPPFSSPFAEVLTCRLDICCRDPLFATKRLRFRCVVQLILAHTRAECFIGSQR